MIMAQRRGRLLSKLTRQTIRRGVFRSVDDLVATNDRYIQSANQDPKPFVWTANAATINGLLLLRPAGLELRPP